MARTLEFPIREASRFLQRFALQTHGTFNQIAAMKFSLEHQNPFVTGIVIGSNPVYSENSYTFLTISDPDVLLWALKPAEDGINQGVRESGIRPMRHAITRYRLLPIFHWERELRILKRISTTP